jgi:hypothetical protein
MKFQVLFTQSAKYCFADRLFANQELYVKHLVIKRCTESLQHHCSLYIYYFRRIFRSQYYFFPTTVTAEGIYHNSNSHVTKLNNKVSLIKWTRSQPTAFKTVWLLVFIRVFKFWFYEYFHKNFMYACMHITSLTFTGICLFANSWFPWQVIVEILTMFTV